MKKINVMQVIPAFGLAGAETMCETLSQTLSKNDSIGLTVVSLYDYRSVITERLEQAGIEVLFLGKKKGLDFRTIGKLARIMKQKRIQVVHTHLYVMKYVIPAAVMAGVKTRIHTVHNIATKEARKLQRKLAWLFFRFFDVVPVAISPRVKETILEEYRLSADQVPMIYNGSDLSKCQRKDSWDANPRFRFVHIGRMTPVKGQALVIQAVKKLKDEGLDIGVDFLGTGEKKDEYKALSRELEVTERVFFRGLQENVYPYLQAADAFLLPSQYEGMPISIIEAMGTGLPVVVSKVGGVPDMVTNEVNGLLIEPELNELVTAMRRIVADKSLREKLGRNARLRAQDFSAENMCAGYLRLYEVHLAKGETRARIKW